MDRPTEKDEAPQDTGWKPAEKESEVPEKVAERDRTDSAAMPR